MPLYDYKCNDCNDVFEVTHSIMEDPSISCPSCQSGLVTRLISRNVGIAFKGSGFYVTDKEKKTSSTSSNT
ncbi:FmdB family transcriptional regulator [bacterium]|nr:FmdB family transcriptional regulator [bacterium]